MHEGSSFVDDIQRDISNIKELRKYYLELNIRIENVFGEEYQKEFLEIYNQQDKLMNDFVRLSTQKVQERREDDLRFSKENEKVNNLREEETRNREHEEKINSFCGIFDNIKERNLLLEEKCNISLCSLSDSEILEKAKDAKILDNEFNKILDWITELIKARPTKYQKAEEVLNTVHDTKNELKMYLF